MNKKIKKYQIFLIATILVIALFGLYYLLTYTNYIVYHGSPSPLFGPCIPLSSFVCQNPSINNAKLLVYIGQNTGTNWTSANFVFVPQAIKNTPSGVPQISFTSYPANITYSDIGLQSGKIIQIILPLNVSIRSGTSIVGNIWVMYTPFGSNTSQYTKIAVLNMKVS